MTANNPEAPGALRGLRVVEFGQYLPGPLMAMLLAEQGADVIKVERPGGDPARQEPAFATWNRMMPLSAQIPLLEAIVTSGGSAPSEIVERTIAGVDRVAFTGLLSSTATVSSPSLSRSFRPSR